MLLSVVMLSLWKVIYRAIDLYLPLLKILTSGHNWFFPFFYYVVYNTILVSRISLSQGNHIYEATQLVIMLLRRHKNVFVFFFTGQNVELILYLTFWMRQCGAILGLEGYARYAQHTASSTCAYLMQKNKNKFIYIIVG